MHKEHTIIVGSGPCGMSSAIELQKKGINPLIIEKGNVVNTVYNFPTHQTFFSSSDKLEIGDTAFITELQNPVRNQALSYYRAVAERKQLRINTYEMVEHIEKSNGDFIIKTKTFSGEEITYLAEHIVIATGYYDQPNMMDIPGEELNKVMHYFKEAHPYYNKDVVVIGGKNSSVDASLELHKAGARVTVLYRSGEYSKSIKPWILPKFDALVKKGIVTMEFNAHVKHITKHDLTYIVGGKEYTIKNDFVFAMTGYHPNTYLMDEVGVIFDKHTAVPTFDEETMETNIGKCYIAGVVAAGIHNNDIFIENGRHHGEQIAESITKQMEKQVQF